MSAQKKLVVSDSTSPEAMKLYSREKFKPPGALGTESPNKISTNLINISFLKEMERQAIEVKRILNQEGENLYAVGGTPTLTSIANANGIGNSHPKWGPMKNYFIPATQRGLRLHNTVMHILSATSHEDLINRFIEEFSGNTIEEARIVAMEIYYSKSLQESYQYLKDLIGNPENDTTKELESIIIKLSCKVQRLERKYKIDIDTLSEETSTLDDVSRWLGAKRSRAIKPLKLTPNDRETTQAKEEPPFRDIFKIDPSCCAYDLKRPSSDPNEKNLKIKFKKFIKSRSFIKPVEIRRWLWENQLIIIHKGKWKSYRQTFSDSIVNDTKKNLSLNWAEIDREDGGEKSKYRDKRAFEDLLKESKNHLKDLVFRHPDEIRGLEQALSEYLEESKVVITPTVIAPYQVGTITIDPAESYVIDIIECILYQVFDDYVPCKLIRYRKFRYTLQEEEWRRIEDQDLDFLKIPKERWY